MEGKHDFQTDSHAKFEIITAILPSFFLTYLLTTLTSHVNTNYILEYLLLAFPLVLNVTIYSEGLREFLFAIILASITVTIFTFNITATDVVQKTSVSSSMKRSKRKLLSFVTNLRGNTNLATGITILAVDFDVFPEKFCKTESYGYSLMDVGVGLFVYMNGIVAKGTAEGFASTLKGVTSLFVCGMVRLVLTQAVGYEVPAHEYGLHWNFFFTLCFVKLVSDLIIKCVGVEHSLVNGISLLFAHEVLLQMGLASYVLNNATPRDTLINANREGLVSTLGYVALYFFATYIGRELRNNADSPDLASKFKLFKKLLVFSAMLLFSTGYCERAFGVSRRLANTGYCVWSLFVGVFLTALYCLGEMIQQYLSETKGRTFDSAKAVPRILDAINFNGLTFFLTCNLLTGFVNITLNTKEYEPLASVGIISVYIFVCVYINYALYKRGIKLKV